MDGPRVWRRPPYGRRALWLASPKLAGLNKFDILFAAKTSTLAKPPTLYSYVSHRHGYRLVKPTPFQEFYIFIPNKKLVA